MKSKAFTLFRTVAVLFLCNHALSAVGKECVGSILVTLKHANDSLEVLHDPNIWGASPYVSVSLGAGDTVLLQQYTSNCGGNRGLSIYAADPMDSTAYGVSLNPAPFNTSTFKLAQAGAYVVSQWGVDIDLMVWLFISGPDPTAAPVGLVFNKVFPSMPFPQGYVAASDTCFTPCSTLYLLDGQIVKMFPVSGELIRPGGQAVVRFAPEGDTVTFDTPADTVPMDGYSGYVFSEDGLYLLSVEDSMFLAPACAFVRVSHQPSPYLALSLTIEHADGTEQEVAYAEPSNVPTVHVDLGPGDSLRIDQVEVTEPCNSAHLRIYKGDDWGPVYWSDSLLMDSASTPAGIHLAESGSYLLRQLSDCGIATTTMYLTINAPVPELDLVIGIVHSDGTETELFRSHVPVDPFPHLETYLGSADSVRVYYEETGWCSSYKYLKIHKHVGPGDASTSDYLLSGSAANLPSYTFNTPANYLIDLNTYISVCYYNQLVHLSIHPPLPEIALRVDLKFADGTTTPVAYAEAGTVGFASVELGANDSLKVQRFFQQAICPETVLKIFHSNGDTATTADSVLLDTPLDASGLMVHETGALLLMLEDTCDAVSGSIQLNVSEAISTGISNLQGMIVHFQNGNGHLLGNVKGGGVLQIRNAMGQLVREIPVRSSSMAVSVPFNDVAPGMYIATMLGPAAINSCRFVVE
ncbi:MAG: hypothetical protein JST38_11625 [Bacteroidetes bacterium]|nr:hypothetical protein [Bacteroidota bacterium]MBS1941511.1 hypothetical protein [Bacteroidota bacterium]